MKLSGRFLAWAYVYAAQRMSLTVEYLKHHLIIYWYNNVCNQFKNFDLHILVTLEEKMDSL